MKKVKGIGLVKSIEYSDNINVKVYTKLNYAVISQNNEESFDFKVSIHLILDESVVPVCVEVLTEFITIDDNNIILCDDYNNRSNILLNSKCDLRIINNNDDKIMTLEIILEKV